MKEYVSIDIGGTALKYGVIDESGSIIHKDKFPTDTKHGGAGITNQVKMVIENYMQKGHSFSGICISSAGMVDVKKGEIFYAGPTIPDYAGTKFKEVLEECYQIPCEVENDVNCAGLAEQVSGAAKGSTSTLCLTIGTGIGGCILLNGTVYHGYSNSACEVGYMNMFDSEFQKLGAASILSEKVAQKKGEALEKWNGFRIFEAAKKGDSDCIEAIEFMVDILCRGIANICYVINPQVVVLGGGIMAQSEYLKPMIDAKISCYLISGILKNTTICFAKHENDAGILGAFYHFNLIREIPSL